VALQRRRTAPIWIALPTTLAANAQGQSHNPKAPVALGARINKGNANNISGPDYYCFYAGAGHIDLTFAFKESWFPWTKWSGSRPPARWIAVINSR
jgi:hypothetical protein